MGLVSIPKTRQACAGRYVQEASASDIVPGGVDITIVGITARDVDVQPTDRPRCPRHPDRGVEGFIFGLDRHGFDGGRFVGG